MARRFRRFFKRPAAAAIRSSLGWNIEEPGAFSASRIHYDFAKYMQWYHPVASGTTFTPSTGFPLSGPSNITIQAREGRTYPQGTYAATWTGSGTGSTGMTVGAGDGAKNLSWDGDLAGFSLKQSAEASNWTQTFLDDAKAFTCIRYMNAWHTNKPEYDPATPWVRVPTPTGANQFIRRLLKPADIVDIANKTGTVSWINLHHKADDTNIQAIANEFAAAGITTPLIVEFSNETWNSSFPQYADIVASASGYTGPGDAARVAAYSIDRSDRIAEIFKTTLTSPVEGIWASWLSVPNQHTQAMANKTRPLDFLDGYAIAPYWGQQWATNTATASSTIQEAIDACETDWNDRLVPNITTWKNNANTDGRKLYFYEFGSSLNNGDSGPIDANLFTISQSSEMGTFYQQRISWFKANAPGIHCLYRRAGVDDAFGHKNHELDTPGSPRWQTAKAN